MDEITIQTKSKRQSNAQLLGNRGRTNKNSSGPNRKMAKKWKYDGQKLHGFPERLQDSHTGSFIMPTHCPIDWPLDASKRTEPSLHISRWSEVHPGLSRRGSLFLVALSPQAPWWRSAHACSSSIGALNVFRICCKETKAEPSKRVALDPAFPGSILLLIFGADITTQSYPISMAL